MSTGIPNRHPGDMGPGEAIRIQKELAGKVVPVDGFEKIDYVAGVDVGYKQDQAKAAVVVLRYPEMELAGGTVVQGRVDFPYIPGLLSFREIPLLVEGFRELKTAPDVILADGQGMAHPRRLGLASHLGLVLQSPVIGCAKSRLWGHFREPGNRKGSFEYLVDKNEKIGAVVRTRDHVRPVFVSVGHRVSLGSSIRVVLTCCTRFRLPEPIRLAHHAAAGNLNMD